MKWLQRVRDPWLSFCKCDLDKDPLGGLCAYPGSNQLDCPWCGCGYMFSCAVCHYAFTFSEAVELSVDPEALAIRVGGRVGLDHSVLQRRTESLCSFEQRLTLGTRYAALDGSIFSRDEPAVFVGIHAVHDFAQAPQFTDKNLHESRLAAPSYWNGRRRSDWVGSLRRKPVF